MRKASAFSPAHVTGFFQICDKSENPLYKGSKGAGFSIKNGVKTTVKIRDAEKTSVKVKINNCIVENAEVSKKVVNLFLNKFHLKQSYEILIEHEIAVPIGMGFGTSGAGALSLALALNEALKLGLSKIEAAQIAHIAEVECKTGLGTVIAETFGGIEIRTKPGAPGIGEVKNIEPDGNYIVASVFFGSSSTKKALTNTEIRRKINAVGEKLTSRLLKNPTVKNFMVLSRIFAEETGLISERARKVLDELDRNGILGSIPIFGDAVFTLIPYNLVKDVEKVFAKYSDDKNNFLISEIDFEGAKLING